MQLGLQHVGLDHVHDLLPLRFCQREEIVPPGILVAHKSPVNARQEVEDIHIRAEEVNEAHPAEPVLLVRLAGVERPDGRSDQVARDAEQLPARWR